MYKSFCTTSYCLNYINVYWELEQRKFQQYSKRLAKLGYTLFFIRTSKFCLRLTVLNYFSFLRLKCSQFVLICPTGPWNGTKKNARLSSMKTHYFISFILFLSSSTHRQPLGGVLQKLDSATVLNPVKKYLRRSSIIH